MLYFLRFMIPTMFNIQLSLTSASQTYKCVGNLSALERLRSWSTVRLSLILQATFASVTIMKPSMMHTCATSSPSLKSTDSSSIQEMQGEAAIHLLLWLYVWCQCESSRFRQGCCYPQHDMTHHCDWAVQVPRDVYSLLEIN